LGAGRLYSLYFFSALSAFSAVKFFCYDLAVSVP
jgi:hypothetical protein